MNNLELALNYLTAHWALVMACLAAATSVVGSVKNILTHFQNPKVAKVEGWLNWVLNLLAVINAKGHDGPLSLLPGPLGQMMGYLSLPGFTSRPQATPAPVIPIKPLVALFLASSIALSGCAGWPIFKDCMKTNLVKDEQAVVTAVIALAMGENYVQDLIGLGKQAGPGLVDCVVQALYADVKSNPKLADLAAHLLSYIGARSSSLVTECHKTA